MTQCEYKKIYAALQEKLRRLYEHDPHGIHEKCLLKCHWLEFKYFNAPKYTLFHLIVGSTISDVSRLWDFPETDSLENFIMDEYALCFPQDTETD